MTNKERAATKTATDEVVIIIKRSKAAERAQFATSTTDLTSGSWMYDLIRLRTFPVLLQVLENMLFRFCAISIMSKSFFSNSL
jgi:hypothetical protein